MTLTLYLSIESGYFLNIVTFRLVSKKAEAGESKFYKLSFRFKFLKSIVGIVDNYFSNRFCRSINNRMNDRTSF